jgi:hypothetical protein
LNTVRIAAASAVDVGTHIVDIGSALHHARPIARAAQRIVSTAICGGCGGGCGGGGGGCSGRGGCSGGTRPYR